MNSVQYQHHIYIELLNPYTGSERLNGETKTKVQLLLKKNENLKFLYGQAGLQHYVRSRIDYKFILKKKKYSRTEKYLQRGVKKDQKVQHSFSSRKSYIEIGLLSVNQSGRNLLEVHTATGQAAIIP